MEVVPEEAETVRIIYKLFLEGKTTQGIANYLMEHGILSPAGKQKWPPSTISSILTKDSIFLRTYFYPLRLSVQTADKTPVYLNFLLSCAA
ncbi:MAG: recombinase family protein [Eubacteriales bacterium]|nr:recombinase family protein [Eubacteriales bacterium]